METNEITSRRHLKVDFYLFIVSLRGSDGEMITPPF